MLTPFETEFTKQVIERFVEEARSAGLDAVAYLNERLLYCAKMYAEDRTPVEAVKAAYRAWTGACIIDDIVNDTGYDRYCTGYENKYREVVDAVSDDLKKTRRKLFKSVPVYDLNQLVFDAHSDLVYVQDKLGVMEGAEPPRLTEDEKRLFLIDRHDELDDALLDLCIRLDEKIDLQNK